MKYITDIMHEYSQMTDEELATHLSQQAHTNKKIKYAFIRDFQERSLAKRYLKALDEIIRGFEKSKELCYNTYVKMVENDLNSDESLTYLLSIKHYEVCLAFYIDDYNTVVDLLSEFTSYLNSGHFFEILLMGMTRHEDEMYDHRYARFVDTTEEEMDEE